jgi:hypothetical protein
MVFGIAAKRQSSTTLACGSRGGQARGGLGRAAFSADQDSPDPGVYSIEDESAAHALLTNDGGKWIDCGHQFSGADYIAQDAHRKAIRGHRTIVQGNCCLAMRYRRDAGSGCGHQQKGKQGAESRSIDQA